MRAFKICIRGHSRSVKMAEFDRPYTTSYQSAIVSIALSCNIFQSFDVEGSLKASLQRRNSTRRRVELSCVAINGPLRSSEMAPFDRSHTTSYFFIVSRPMTISCIICETQRDIGPRSKIPLFLTPFILPLKYLSPGKNFGNIFAMLYSQPSQTARLQYGVKYCRKFNSLREHQHYRRQT